MRQVQFNLEAKSRGFHLITGEVLSHLGELPDVGLLHLFCMHTSAGICISENADPDVRTDYEFIFNKLVPENMSGLKHTLEGPDDMPAHIKATLTGIDLTIPIKDGRLVLGTWQGIYLCEFRNRGGSRKMFATIMD